MSKRYDLHSHVLGIIVTLTEIYRVSGFILFVLCSSSASTVFSRLKSDIEAHTPSANTVSSIVKWKHIHALNCLCVDWINRCFGPVLLIDSGCIFLRVMMCAFQAFTEFKEKRVSRLSVYQTMNTLELFFQFVVICTVADRLRIKV